jgi:hypothetical protein
MSALWKAIGELLVEAVENVRDMLCWHDKCSGTAGQGGVGRLHTTAICAIGAKAAFAQCGYRIGSSNICTPSVVFHMLLQMMALVDCVC